MKRKTTIEIVALFCCVSKCTISFADQTSSKPRLIVLADMGKRIHFIEGGGTIPWLRLVSQGLTDPSEPSWGGWSGRYTSKKVLNVSVTVS